jgi:hypothetical protein
MRLSDYRATCGDCGVKEGQLHQLGCDMEPCSSCGGQRVYCPCSGAQRKRRVPFILYPTLCAKCGKHWPDLFMVPDAEWERYVELGERASVLCKPCYTQIKTWIDEA